MLKNIRFAAAIILLAFSTLSGFSQWTQRQSLTGGILTFATSFTINNLIYVVGGYDGSTVVNEVWAYDPTTNSWTQKANFPGGNRSSATAFTIGSKAYLGTGNDGNIYLHDFWEYDPLTDSWNAKADFPGYERDEAVGFSIGNKGYLGTGQTFVVGPNNSFTTTYSDFFEYDPAINLWTQKDSFPGAPRACAIGASIGNKGYIGLGGNDDQSVSYTDFYEYDPANDSWTTKTSMTGSGRADAGAFVNGNNLYVIGGINFPTFAGFSSCRMYDAITDTWVSAPVFNPGVILAPVVQNVNGRVFAGTGYYNNQVPRNDWWEFTSLPTLIDNVEMESFIYPNPFSNEINLNLKDNAGEYRIELEDLFGRIVYSSKQYFFESNAITISTANFSSGIYLLKVKNRSGEIVALKKLIRN